MAAEEIGGYMLVGGYGLMLLTAIKVFGLRRVLALLLALLVGRIRDCAPDGGRDFLGSVLASG